MKGETLLIDLYNAPRDILSSAEILSLFLIRCTELIGMTPVKQTLQVVHFPISQNKSLKGDFGISAGLILVESHIYIHTWTEKNYARLEISSCKEINEKIVLLLCEIIFGDDLIISYKKIKWGE